MKTYLIDGYNLLHAVGIIGRGIGPGGLERSRLALLNFLVESLDPKEAATTYVSERFGIEPWSVEKALARHRKTIRTE